MAQDYRNQYLAEGRKHVCRWSNKINEVNKNLTEAGRPKMSIELENTLARCLSNTRERIALTEATQVSGLSGVSTNGIANPYNRYAIDIIAGMFPNVIALDLVSTQALEKKFGLINYVKYYTGPAKGSVAANSVIADTFNYNGVAEDYTSCRVGGENIPASAVSVSGGTATITLAWKPLDTNVVPVIHTTAGDVEGTITDAANGTVTFALTTAEDITVDYQYNNSNAPAQVPELNMTIDAIMVQAQPRKLKALWAFDAALELQKDYAQDMQALLAAQASAEIAHEIDEEILNDIYVGAYRGVGNAPLTWSAVAPFGVSLPDHFRSFLAKLNEGSQRIFQNTKRAHANWLVCGSAVAAVVESIPEFKPAAESNPVGPYFMGTLGGYKVYNNPFFGANNFLLGYKGNTLFDAGYVYAPYLPITTTQMVMLDRHNIKQVA